MLRHGARPCLQASFTYPVREGVWWASLLCPDPPADTRRNSGSPECRPYLQKTLLPRPAASELVPSRARCGSSQPPCTQSFPAQSSLQPLKRICALHLYLKQNKTNDFHWIQDHPPELHSVISYSSQHSLLLFLLWSSASPFGDSYLLKTQFKHLKPVNPWQNT